MKFDLILNQPDTGEISINMDDPAVVDIASGKIIKMVYRGAPIGSGGFFIENISQDYSASGDRSGRWVKCSGRGGLAILDDAVVWSTTQSVRKFTAVTMASIMILLISEAQARGCFPNLRVSFTAALDSGGIPWVDSTTVDINSGTSLLDVMRQFSELGVDFKLNIEWAAGDYALYAYVAPFGVDKSNDVVVRIGHNALQLTDTQESSGLKNAFLVNYQGGLTSMTDPTSITAYRRREAMFQAGNAPTSPSALILAGAELAEAKDPRRSITVKINDGVNPPRVFVDYDIGDLIGVDFGDGALLSKYRIRGMALNWPTDKKFAEVTLTLNSLRVEQEIRNAIALRKIANGSTSSALSGTPPNSTTQVSAHDADVNAHLTRPMTGDLTGMLGAAIVAKLRGIVLKNPLTFLAGHLLKYNLTTNQLEPGYVDWPEIENKPATFAPEAHEHDAGAITSGMINQDRLGTGSSGTGTKYLNDAQVYETPGGSGDVIAPVAAMPGHMAVFGADPRHIEDGGAPGGGSGSVSGGINNYLRDNNI